MARYEITAPNGQKFEITAPDDATEDQVMQYAQQQFAAQQAQITDVPSPEQDQAVAQYYAQQQDAPAPSMKDRAVAAGEAGLSLLSGATTGLLGQAAGAVGGIGRSISAGNFGTQEGADQAQQYAGDVSASATYQPKTQLGQEYLSNVAETLEPLSAIPPIAEAALIANSARSAARASPGQIQNLVPQAQANSQKAERIAAGETGKDLAKYKLDENALAAGKKRARRDPSAIEAVKQGFDEGVISAIKASSLANRKKLAQMVDVAEKAKKDALYGASNRPADIAGDSLLDRVRSVKQVNQQASKDLDVAAQKLKGATAVPDGALGQFYDELDSMGISVNENGIPNFRGSDIEDLATSERAVKQIIGRLNRVGDDAYKMHQLKRYIDEIVTYGKGSPEGLSGRTERVLKNLRRNIDQTLDESFPEYNDANTRYADTVNAIEMLQDAAGTKVNLFGENADKATGTVLRRLLSNTQSRANLIDSIKNLDEVSAKYGAKFDDDIMTQVLFADELDSMFGTTARTSLRGDVERGTKRAAERLQGDKTLTGLAIDAAAKGAERLRGINDENAFKSIKKLLQEQK